MCLLSLRLVLGYQDDKLRAPTHLHWRWRKAPTDVTSVTQNYYLGRLLFQVVVASVVPVTHSPNAERSAGNLTNTQQVAWAYINALRVQKMAEEAVANAKAILTETFAQSDITSETVNGETVIMTEAERRNFNAEALAQLITASVYKAVTKVTVDNKAFDKAREAGDISADVEQAVVKPTKYIRLNVVEAGEVATDTDQQVA